MTGPANLRRTGIAAAAAALIILTSAQAARAQIDGCPGNAGGPGDKVVVGSVAEVAGAVGGRLSRALLAAFEMRFEKADSELKKEAMILYCDGRRVRDIGSYSAGVVDVLNDDQVLLEVGARADGADIVVTYVVIPIRHYVFFQDGQRSIPGYHQSVYELSRISAGLQDLFKGNAELRLMAALALALRYEKIADAETDAARRVALVHRSRAFYCDAIGSLEATRPHGDLLGLEVPEWEALRDFAHAGAERLFQKATADPGYVSTLSVVASERGGQSTACVS
jgi:hypothetical protein